MCAAPLIPNVSPNSKQGKLSGDHCRFIFWVENADFLSTNFNIKVSNKSCFLPIDISIKDTLLHYNCFFSSENGYKWRKLLYLFIKVSNKEGS